MSEGAKFWLQILATCAALVIIFVLSITVDYITAVPDKDSADTQFLGVFDTDKVTIMTNLMIGILFLAAVYSGMNQSKLWFITFGSLFTVLILWQTAIVQEWLEGEKALSTLLWLSGVEIPTSEKIDKSTLFRIMGFVFGVVIVVYGTYNLSREPGKLPQIIAYLVIAKIVAWWAITQVFETEVIFKLTDQYLSDVNGVLAAASEGDFRKYKFEADWHFLWLIIITIIIGFLIWSWSKAGKAIFGRIILVGLFVGAAFLFWPTIKKQIRTYQDRVSYQQWTPGSHTINFEAGRIVRVELNPLHRLCGVGPTKVKVVEKGYVPRGQPFAGRHYRYGLQTKKNVTVDFYVIPGSQKCP